jgi:glycosyltransferase involved in cell wall biosynthesis
MNPVPMDWSGLASYWVTYNNAVAAAIEARKATGDFVCVINGHLNSSLKRLTGVQLVEYAIGYTGTFADYRVFASHAHQNKIYGAQGGLDPDGKWYDTVIHHYLDPSEFPLKTSTRDYFLYIGRLTPRKGVQIAVDICNHLGVKLKLAGNGDKIYTGECVEYVGNVSAQEKIVLYQNAIATICPTQYLEPFGMTVIESQMCGTPVITTNFGSFPELVEQGKTGFRCQTFNQFVSAAKKSSSLDPKYIREHAVTNWGLDTIRFQYEQYFETLIDLWADGWYTLHNSQLENRS